MGQSVILPTLFIFTYSLLIQEFSQALPLHDRQAVGYLSRYGYLPESTSDGRVAYASASQILPAIQRLQEMARIPVTDSRWEKSVLTWRVTMSTSHLPASMVVNTLKHAFTVWSDVTNIRFIYRSSGDVDIKVMFLNADHQDGYSFDGSGGVLAHAFPPPPSTAAHLTNGLAGDLHFDEGERWTVSLPTTGVDLLTVAVHEIGHSLGLQHSNAPGSVMWPWSANETSDSAATKLAYDDILAVQLLYGGREKRYGHGSSSHYLCQYLGVVDAMFKALNDKIYVFTGELVTTLDNITLESVEEPQPISKVFPGFPEERTVDAAVTYQGIWQSGISYLFSRNQYWRYVLEEDGVTLKADPTEPLDIDNWLLGVDRIDTAFLFQHDMQLYFTKGTKYWIHTGTSLGSYAGSPQNFSRNAILNGINETLTAGYLHSNATNYLFTSSGVWTFQSDSIKVTRFC